MLLVTTASKRRIQWRRGQAAGGGGRQRASRPMPAPMAGLPVLQVALIASLWCPQPALQPQDSGRQVLRRATPPKWVAPGTQTPGARCVERLMPLIDCCKGPAGLRKPRHCAPVQPLPPLALPQLEDLDGTQHYTTLGVEPTASAEEIKKARGPPPLLSPLPPARPPPLPSVLGCSFPADCSKPSRYSSCRPIASWPSSTIRTRVATQPLLRACRCAMCCSHVRQQHRTPEPVQPARRFAEQHYKSTVFNGGG